MTVRRRLFSFLVYDCRMPRAVALFSLSVCLLGTGTPRARAAVTVATVGDSLADAIYLGLKLQPDLLRKSGINLIRWSRPKIGLTRTDYFDYTAWVRDTGELGSADFCVVEMGANDLQSIASSGQNSNEQKWFRVGTDAWQRAYTDRVQAFVRTLKAGRCGKVVWLLQPPYQKNKFLSQYHEMMNAVQLAGSSSGASVFDIAAGEDDYSPDGIHPNKDFSFKLARAVANLFASWQPPLAGSNCGSCHVSSSDPPFKRSDLTPLVPRNAD